MKSARAAVLVEPRRFEVQEIPIPDIDEDSGLMRVESCGICASDVPIFRGETLSLGFELPVILGHEIVGRVERVGASAAARWGVQEGDRIIVERWIPCGHCERCYRGDYRLCVPVVEGHRLFYGGAPTALAPALYGGYSEYLYLHPNAVVYKVDPKVPAEQVPLFTPIGNAISWLTKLGGAGIGSHVVIEGPGQEGLAAVVVAAAAGAGSVTVTGLPSDRHRLEVCRELGATHTAVIGEDDPIEVVREATAGRMADVVLDVTSTDSAQPMELALRLAGVGATVVCPSFHRESTAMDFPTSDLISRTVTVKGAYGRDRDSVFAALSLITSGRHPLERITTHQVSIDDVDLGLRMVARETDDDPLHVSVVMEQE